MSDQTANQPTTDAPTTDTVPADSAAADGAVAQPDAGTEPTQEQTEAAAELEDKHSSQTDNGPKVDGLAEEGEDGPKQGHATLHEVLANSLRHVEEELGFSGTNPDPHDNDHYTVAGQIAAAQDRQEPAADRSLKDGGGFFATQHEHPSSVGPSGPEADD